MTGFTFIGRGMPIYRLPDDTLIWFGRWDPTSATGPNWYSMTYMTRSQDGGKTWSAFARCREHVFEGGMRRLPSGRLLASLRYQRPPRPDDPKDIHQHARGRSSVDNSRNPFKHVFRLDSRDQGRTWTNFRQLAVGHGQPHGFPAALSDGTVVVVRTNGYHPNRSGLAMVSHDEGRPGKIRPTTCTYLASLAKPGTLAIPRVSYSRTTGSPRLLELPTRLAGRRMPQTSDDRT